MPLERKRRGDRADIKLQDWNTIGETVDIVQDSRAFLNGKPIEYSRESAIVWVYNGSGGNVDRHGVLGLDGILVTESENADRFVETPAFEGYTPSRPDHLGRFAVLLEPIADEGMGRACLIGATVANVQINDATDTHAEILNGSTAKLTSGKYGTARILYKPSGTGDKLCWVKIGHDPGPTVRPFTFTGSMSGQYANVDWDDQLGGSGQVYDRYGEYASVAVDMHGHAAMVDGQMEIIGITDCDGYT